MRCRLLLLGVAIAVLPAAKTDPLAEYTPGPAKQCIDTRSNSGPEVTDDGRILYRTTAKRIWMMRPIGPCPALRPQTTLIVEMFNGSQLCRNDRFRVLENGASIPSGYCRVGMFVPYSKL